MQNIDPIDFKNIMEALEARNMFAKNHEKFQKLAQELVSFLEPGKYTSQLGGAFTVKDEIVRPDWKKIAEKFVNPETLQAAVKYSMYQKITKSKFATLDKPMVHTFEDLERMAGERDDYEDDNYDLQGREN